jgi:hypothetical protein
LYNESPNELILPGRECIWWFEDRVGVWRELTEERWCWREKRDGGRGMSVVPGFSEEEHICGANPTQMQHLHRKGRPQNRELQRNTRFF